MQSNTSKIVLAVIILTAILGSGIYYWKNSKTSSPPTTNESSDISDELPIVKEKTKTANWKIYTNMGVNIRYPNDGTYTIDKQKIRPEVEGFTILQAHPGNKIYVYRTATDQTVAMDNFSIKEINGKSYKEFFKGGLEEGYGYVIKHNGQFYTFESAGKPDIGSNEVFELMMTTVIFE